MHAVVLIAVSKGTVQEHWPPALQLKVLQSILLRLKVPKALPLAPPSRLEQ